MEQTEINILTIVVLGVIWNMFRWFKEKTRPRRIAVIEDSDDDFMLFKMFFHMENTIIDRYKTADNLPLEFAKNRPDAVIADYYLEGEIKGDEVIKLCDKFRIPARLVTGYEGDILGVKSDRVLRKSSDKEYFAALQNWAQHQLA